MIDIPLKYREAVDTYQTVEFEGHKLFPVVVREWGEFQAARPAIDIVQQSLPVRFLSMPLLSAYFEMEKEARVEGKPSEGLFFKAILFLVLALRFRRGLKIEDRVNEMIGGVRLKEGSGMLSAIVYEINGEEKRITPAMFQRMRPILAEQNGIVLESEDANPELLEAERDIADTKGAKLDYNLPSLLAFVSSLSHAEESELYGWPILKLTRRRDVYERIFAHLIYGIASANGAQFKDGNPVPSAVYERLNLKTGALLDISSVTGGQQVILSKGKDQ